MVGSDGGWRVGAAGDSGDGSVVWCGKWVSWVFGVGVVWCGVGWEVGGKVKSGGGVGCCA